MKKLFLLFICIVYLLYNHQWQYRPAKQELRHGENSAIASFSMPPAVWQDSVVQEYYTILNGLKLNYVFFYRHLKTTSLAKMGQYGLPEKESIFRKDSLMYEECYARFFRQDYLFIDWLLHFKNDTTHSGLWSERVNPYSSTRIECNFSMTNSRAAIILLQNFLDGQGFRCYGCNYWDGDCTMRVYAMVERFVALNRKKDIASLRLAWKLAQKHHFLY